VANLDAVQTVEETSFQIPGENTEELLHDWLSELLYVFHVRQLLLVEFHVEVGPAGLTATARGEPINLVRHKIDAEVKAITWCDLKVAQIANQWQAEVIVDV
jgi:SHS2 domain-containing protein